MELVVAFIAGTLISAFCLWAGMKLTGVDGTFIALLIISGVSSLFGFIPVAGGIIRGS